MQKPRSFWAGVHRILSTKTEFANGIEIQERLGHTGEELNHRAESSEGMALCSFHAHREG